MKVIGLRKVDFKATDGSLIQGLSIYVTFPIEKGGTGLAADKLFLSASKVEMLEQLPQVGDEIDVTYNRWGKVDKIFIK